MKRVFALGFFLVSITLLFWAAQSSSAGNEPTMVHSEFSRCEPEILTSDEPFFVSATDREMAEKEWDNFRNYADHTRIIRYIPRMTIVRPLSDEENMSLRDATGRRNFPPDSYVPVKVMGLRDPRAFDNMASNRHLARRVDPCTARTSRCPNNRRLESVQIGDVGLIFAQSLKPAKDFNFIVTENAQFLNLPETVMNSLRGKTVRVATRDGKYRARICCKPDSPEQCITNYIFQVIGSADSAGRRIVEREVAMAPRQCESFLHALNPVLRSQTDAIRSLVTYVQQTQGFQGVRDLEFFDSVGLVKVPLDYRRRIEAGHLGGNAAIQMGPGTHSFHYTPDDYHSGDAFNDPTSVCAFVNVIRRWEQMCPQANCAVGWGNCYHPPAWGVHGSHGSKYCFDLRPITRDRDTGGVTVYQRNYDRENTQRLVDLLTRAGGVGIFNDGSYVNMFFDDSRVNGVRSAPNADHSDHIHVCFPADRPEVQNACARGLQ